MTRNSVAAFLVLGLLAACGTPQQQCISRNTSEYRTVARLLGEVEGNLARGYAWDERPYTTTEWADCPRVVRDRDGNAQVISVPCPRRVTEIERYRVPIDPASESRKRDNLQSRLAALQPGAEAAVRACRVAYPEADA
ncbi:hypothetical protein GI374_10565 [Paracoccus sp. S-4012]|uniref:hypothetical protein n=1 Tax=Paracoccus sp. S-4012 TaxID=2665648 RepID=UPI0012B0C864|nr:hypothetical protein [Paracoccus sp. S-4012]MRX50882.1 hypothetical protein [Paracoccus sp. S-4012]